METFVSGICLIGSEVKSVRASKISTNDSYCYFKDDELFVKNFFIYENKNALEHDQNRDKKLLLKKKWIIQTKKEINKRTFNPVNKSINKWKRSY